MIFNSAFVLSLVAATAQLVAAAPLESGLSSSVVLEKRGAPLDGTTVDRLAKRMQIAAAAYCPQVVNGSSWTCGRPCQGATAGTRVITKFGQDNTAAAVGAVTINDVDKTIVVMFRGSASDKDWAQNFKFGLNFPAWLKKTPQGAVIPTAKSLVIPSGIQVHSGFQENYQAVRTVVQTTLNNTLAANPTYNVEFVGHSLGGSEAAIAAFDTVQLRGAAFASRISVYTYGMPRTGNSQFATWFATLGLNVYRVTRMNDPVPHLPPGWVGYRHVKQEYGINTAGVSIACTNESATSGETKDCMTVNYKADNDIHVTGYYGWITSPDQCFTDISFANSPCFGYDLADGVRTLLLARIDGLWTLKFALRLNLLAANHPFTDGCCILCNQSLNGTHEWAHFVVSCTGLAIQRDDANLAPFIAQISEAIEHKLPESNDPAALAALGYDDDLLATFRTIRSLGSVVTSNKSMHLETCVHSPRECARFFRLPMVCSSELYGYITMDVSDQGDDITEDLRTA
ncbi:Alpha/Beta hydrolase protein [Entophlyctis helioformis]|nr:Alpha/Beta hydrolase protein [Entophlyctis helioformis]